MHVSTHTHTGIYTSTYTVYIKIICTLNAHLPLHPSPPLPSPPQVLCLIRDLVLLWASKLVSSLHDGMQHATCGARKGENPLICKEAKSLWSLIQVFPWSSCHDNLQFVHDDSASPPVDRGDTLKVEACVCTFWQGGKEGDSQVYLLATASIILYKDLEHLQSQVAWHAHQFCSSTAPHHTSQHITVTQHRTQSHGTDHTDPNNTRLPVRVSPSFSLTRRVRVPSSLGLTESPKSNTFRSRF